MSLEPLREEATMAVLERHVQESKTEPGRIERVRRKARVSSSRNVQCSKGFLREPD